MYRPVSGVRVAAHPLRAAAATALRLALDRLEHPGELPRIVAARAMTAPSRSAAVLAATSQRGAEPNWRLRDHAADGPPDHRAANGASELPSCSHGFCARGVGVPYRNSTCELVGHHAGDFAFSRRRVEHAAVDVHRPAGQRERVDLFQVHRREGVLVDLLVELRRRRGNQPIAQAGQIAGDPLVADDRVLLSNFSRGLATELHVLLRRVSVLGRLDDRLGARPRHGYRKGDHQGRGPHRHCLDERHDLHSFGSDDDE
jgi:hypothetical protein